MLSEKIIPLFFSKNKKEISKIVQTFEEEGFGFLLIIFSIPSALPVPAPGYSIPFGIVLLVFGVQMLLGRRTPWIPKKIGQKKIGALTSKKAEKTMQWFLKFFEKFIHERWSLFQKKYMYNVFGFFVVLCSISMMIPIPLTNTLPALGIFIMGVSLVQKDGLFGLLGIFASIGALSISLLILYFGVEIISAIVDFFLNMF